MGLGRDLVLAFLLLTGSSTAASGQAEDCWAIAEWSRRSADRLEPVRVVLVRYDCNAETRRDTLELKASDAVLNRVRPLELLAMRAGPYPTIAWGPREELPAGIRWASRFWSGYSKDRFFLGMELSNATLAWDVLQGTLLVGFTLRLR